MLVFTPVVPHAPDATRAAGKSRAWHDREGQGREGQGRAGWGMAGGGSLRPLVVRDLTHGLTL